MKSKGELTYRPKQGPEENPPRQPCRARYTFRTLSRDQVFSHHTPCRRQESTICGWVVSYGADWLSAPAAELQSCEHGRTTDGTLPRGTVAHLEGLLPLCFLISQDGPPNHAGEDGAGEVVARKPALDKLQRRQGQKSSPCVSVFPLQRIQSLTAPLACSPHKRGTGQNLNETFASQCA